MKEYIVIARNEESIDSLHQDLTSDTRLSNFLDKAIIPTREVAVANARPSNARITHYILTDDEARGLKNDPRVVDVHEPPKEELKIKLAVPIAFNNSRGNYKRNVNENTLNINWGLRRTSIPSPELRPKNEVVTDRNGTGVDIIVIDDGVQKDHPEFLDVTGTTRVKEIDWYKATGVAGSMPPNHYDYTLSGSAEHGTHVASIAAGKTFGYASNSRIYSIRVFGANDAVIPYYDIFDLVRIWHRNKPVDIKTGLKRPTIVNISWGYFAEYAPMYAVGYRGATKLYKNPVSADPTKGQLGLMHGYRYASIDAELKDCIDAGVIVVHSAGNTGHKIDVPNGKDYNNYYCSDSSPYAEKIYYHRGASPSSEQMITVAASDSQIQFDKTLIKERLVYFSERGPGCDVVAPGSEITAGTSSATTYSTTEYMWGTERQRKFNITTLSGTSMAAPQVAGVIALYLSGKPGATPAQAKKWLADQSIKDMLVGDTNDADYQNEHALLKGPNKYLYNPYRNKFKDL